MIVFSFEELPQSAYIGCVLHEQVEQRNVGIEGKPKKSIPEDEEHFLNSEQWVKWGAGK